VIEFKPEAVHLRVDCYRLCPRVDEKGAFQEAHPDWKKECT